MVFDDHEAFITHQASEHHLTLAGAMRPFIRGLVLDYGRPVAGAFGDTNGARPVDVPDIEADRRRSYAERYSEPDFGRWDR
jgi:hypothetical protein